MRVNFLDRKLQFTIAIVFLVIMFALPYFLESSMPDSQRKQIQDQVNKDAKEATVASIFGNNAYIALFTLTPIFGIPWIATIMYNTGRVCFAYQPSPLLLALSPIVWIEFTANAWMLVTSVNLFKLLYHRKMRESFRLLRNSVFIMVVLLFFGAVLEKLIIG